MTPEEMELDAAMNKFVDAAEFDNKMMIRHLKRMALSFAGLIAILLVAIYAR